MRILLTGGGTAGHINPAIAIAEIIKQNCPQAEIAFVGTPNGMENRLVGQAGYPLYPVRVMGFSRSLSPSNLKAAWYALTSPRKARQILADFCPDAVIGTGGYVSWPLLSAAASVGIPCALHESNALPGLTTRRLAPKMDAVWLNFRETAEHPSLKRANTVHTGNPLRQGFFTVTRKEARAALGIADDRLVLLSFGGSRGAAVLNDVCLGADGDLFAELPHLLHIHACGTRYYDECALRCKKREGAILLPYIDRMPLYMGASDIVICRAGAMTLSELALCKKCAILIPSPNVTDNHQHKNASVLQNAGAAILLEEKTLTPQILTERILALFASEAERKTLSKKIYTFAMPHTGQILWREICRLCRKN